MDDDGDRNEYTLTSFEPLSPEDEKSGLRKFFEGIKTKTLLSLGRSFSHDNVNVDQRLSQASNNDLNNRKEDPNFKSNEIFKTNDNSKTELSNESVNENARTPTSVLRRLTHLALLEKTDQKRSQVTNSLKKFWMPDEQCKECYECNQKFSTFRRRHHCRLCGQIFCNRCCNQVVSGQQIGYTGVFRVCIYCKKIVLTYTSGADIQKNLMQLKEDLSLVSNSERGHSPLNQQGWSTYFPDPELKISFDVFGVSAEEANLVKQDSYKELWRQIISRETGLEFVTHRVRFRTYSACFIARDLTNWLLINRKAANRTVALHICQNLYDLGWIEPVGEKETMFKDDFILYTPGPRANGDIIYTESFASTSSIEARDTTSSWLTSSFDKSSYDRNREGFHKSYSTSTIVTPKVYSPPFNARSLSYENVLPKRHEKHVEQTKMPKETSRSQQSCIDIFVNVDNAFLPKTVTSENVEEGAETENDVIGDVKQDNARITAKDLKISSAEEREEKNAREKLSVIHKKHISAFLVQLLDRVGLHESWKDVIENVAIKVCNMVSPDIKNNDDMDIREYVKIKKIPEGSRSECRIVSGVVCTKNVVHKKMAPAITQPLVLMLACPVDYQRVENKMASLDSLVLQEHEFIKNLVGRIAALKPTLLLVEKSVSRLAQDMLLARGISVIINIKHKLMARISRCVEGDVLPSLDQGSRPRLGSCQTFKIQKYTFQNDFFKTLAFFEGCTPKLGATVILRGGSHLELRKVRNILRFMIFIVYNSKLEQAFIIDEFGMPFVEDEQDRESENGKESSLKRSEVLFTIEGESTVKEEDYENEETNEGGFMKYDTDEQLCESDVDLKHDEHASTTLNSELLLNHCVDDKNFDRDDSSVKEMEINGETFMKFLHDNILSSSPLIQYPLPFFLTAEGKNCELRKFISDDMYWTSTLLGRTSLARRNSPEELEHIPNGKFEDVILVDSHPFVFANTLLDGGNPNVLDLLASFRAQGGRIRLMENVCVKDVLDEEKFEVSYKQENDVLKQYTLRDCFDPFQQQMIAVVFSSYSRESANFPRPCIAPCTVFMEFYGKNDITLGYFLERYCFRPSYVCPNPNCDVPMVKHVRYFAHGDGAVYVNMKNLESPIPGFSTTLLTWSWCKECKQVTPVVKVSPEAWNLSFAKYLELRIYATQYGRRATMEPCKHSLHQDHYQYFALNNIVASLKYVSLNIYKVKLPPTVITIIEEKRQPSFWVKLIQTMSKKIDQLIKSINERIAVLKVESHNSKCFSDIEYDKAPLEEKVKVLESKAKLLSSPLSFQSGSADDESLLLAHEVSAVEYEISDGIIVLKRMICECWESWNSKLMELIQFDTEKKKNKSIEKQLGNSLPRQNPAENCLNMDVFTNNVAIPQKNHNPNLTSQINSFSVDDTLSLAENNSFNSADGKFGQDLRHPDVLPSLTESLNTSDLDRSSTEDEPKLEDGRGPKIKRIFSQFLPGLSSRSIPCPFPLNEHHMLPLSDVIPIVVNEKEPTSIIAYTLSSSDYRKHLQRIQASIDEYSESFTCIDGDETLKSSECEKSRARARSETLSNTSLMSNIEDDLVENYFQWNESEDDTVLVVDSVQKSSSLTTNNSANDEENGKEKEKIVKYKSKSTVSPAKVGLHSRNQANEATKEREINESEESIADGKDFTPSSSSTQDDTKYHIRHPFLDSSAKFFCIVYFAEQFRKIRKALFPDGEERYIRSLQHCMKWQATGGKSGSSFCKTTDDRFVIKEMSRPEAQSFLNIAPYYFQYIEKAIVEKKPTLLAKILGVYRIGFNSKQTNVPVRKDLLVMDNILYNCKVDQVYDLKGSIRSRYVNHSSDKENNVLLDENLLEMITECPLFIRPHSKAVLSRAINNDTEFLVKHMVMDYSLLLGIERSTSTCVVGIIDFIRTFTWDKKLEMYVKSTGILGGQGKMPTVVSPELYRERFCSAMQRYFLMTPNKWLGLGNEVK